MAIYFEGIKTNVFKCGRDGKFLNFVLEKVFELGYLTNTSDDILKQVNEELKNRIFKQKTNLSLNVLLT